MGKPCSQVCHKTILVYLNILFSTKVGLNGHQIWLIWSRSSLNFESFGPSLVDLVNFDSLWATQFELFRPNFQTHDIFQYNFVLW